MTITTKNAKSYKEAMELVKEFHAFRPDCYFVYNTENYSDDYKTTKRFFNGMGQDGYGICFAMIEFVTEGKLEKVRVINTYRNIALDIEIKIDDAEIEAANEEKIAARFTKEELVAEFEIGNLKERYNAAKEIVRYRVNSKGTKCWSVYGVYDNKQIKVNGIIKSTAKTGWHNATAEVANNMLGQEVGITLADFLNIEEFMNNREKNQINIEIFKKETKITIETKIAKNETIDEANIANETDEIDKELTATDISEETLIIMAASLKVIADECYPKDSELWNITMTGSREAQAELDRRESDEDFTFYDAQIHSYDDDFVSEQFDNPIDAYKWLEMKIKQSYALERGTRQIEFYGKDSYKVIYRYIPDCRELFIDDTLLENFITNRTPKFTYRTKRGKIRTLKIGETNLGTEDNTILNQPKMPPVALKSHANSHDNTNTIDREKTSQIGIEAKIAQLNKNAPDNLQISFDKDKNNFPVKFKGKTITTLDTLALKNFLTPEQFFQQFRPLVDKDYSPKEQFIDDRKKELANLQEMRKSIKDTGRLKTIDALIDIIKRDLLEVSLE